ncbi:MAG: autotransporter domain-containing protein [Hyphomicrobiales bacterium]
MKLFRLGLLAGVAVQLLCPVGAAQATDYVISSGSTVTSPVSVAVDGDTLTVETGATVSVSGDFAITAGAEDVTVTVAGTVKNASRIGVELSDNSTLVISGSVQAGTYGAVVGAGNSVLISGTLTGGVGGLDGGQSGLVVNAGTIEGVRYGVTFDSDSSLTNTGTITADTAGIYVDGSDDEIVNSGQISGGYVGVYASGDHNLISNSGDITGGGSGLVVDGNGNQLVNSGSISGGSYYGVALSGTGNSLENSGEIQSNAWGVYISGSGTVINRGTISGGTIGVEADSSATISNSGDISGGSIGLMIGGSDNLVSNSGTIEGGSYGILIKGPSVGTTGTGNVVSNRGTVVGGTYAIEIFGTGNTLNILAGSNIQGKLSMTSGNDLYIGKGLNTAITYSGDPTITIGSGVGVDTGAIIAAVDPTGFAAEDERLNDLTRAVADAVDARLAASRGGPAQVAQADGRLIHPVADVPPEQSMALWAAALGQRGSETERGTDVGFDTRLGGALIGVDGQAWDGLRLGVFGGYAAARFKTETDSQTVDARNYLAGLYAGLERENWFANLSVNGGRSRQSSDRTVLNNTVAGGIEHAEADYDGLFLSPVATVGTHISFERGTLTPSLRARYAVMALDDYVEEGSTADMTVEDRNVSLADLRGQLAFDLRPWDGGGGLLQVTIRGGADLTYSNSDAVDVELLSTALHFDAGKNGTAARGFLGLDMSYVAPGGVNVGITSELGAGSGDSFDASLAADLQVPL